MVVFSWSALPPSSLPSDIRLLPLALDIDHQTLNGIKTAQERTPFGRPRGGGGRSSIHHRLILTEPRYGFPHAVYHPCVAPGRPQEAPSEHSLFFYFSLIISHPRRFFSSSISFSNQSDSALLNQVSTNSANKDLYTYIYIYESRPMQPLCYCVFVASGQLRANGHKMSPVGLRGRSRQTLPCPKTHCRLARFLEKKKKRTR